MAVVGLLLLVVLWVLRRKTRTMGYATVRNRDTATTFADDVERGLTSDTFDLTLHNLAQDDTRPGLSEGDQILEIMREMGCTFDQARLIRQQRMFRAHGIDPQTGLPLDPKAIYFKTIDAASE